ncbi:MAG TPA: FAD-binding oxidoreductase [Vicinamibacteria bacterium]|nr:FAD-binding oxidoreductase [Vicinamibacteria bacterium]
MNRRHFFQIFSGVAVAALPGARKALAAPRRIGVVGGGIMGASITYHLARRGAEVTLFEKTKPASGATANSFAWINATFSKKPHHYFHLNRLGALGYRHLERELGGDLEVQWGGSLEWYHEPDRARWLRQQVASHQSWGYPTRLVEVEEFKKLEKNVEPGDVAAASWSEEEGSLDPVRAAEVLVDHAARQGARVVFPCEVTAIDQKWGRLTGVRTTAGDFELDVVVVAAGVDTAKLGAMAGIEVPLVESPGVLAHTKPGERLVDRVVLSPGAHMKQKLDGRVVAGMGFGAAPSRSGTEEEGQKVLEAGRKYLPGLAKLSLEKVTLGFRPLPKDGYPLIGFPDGAPGVYLAVMHSGVTLCPIVSRLAALEILDGVEVELLASYRHSRFDSKRSS